MHGHGWERKQTHDCMSMKSNISPHEHGWARKQTHDCMSMKSNISPHEYGNKHISHYMSMKAKKHSCMVMSTKANISMHEHEYEIKHISAWTWVRKQTHHCMSMEANISPHAWKQIYHFMSAESNTSECALKITSGKINDNPDQLARKQTSWPPPNDVVSSFFLGSTSLPNSSRKPSPRGWNFGHLWLVA